MKFKMIMRDNYDNNYNTDGEDETNLVYVPKGRMERM